MTRSAREMAEEGIPLGQFAGLALAHALGEWMSQSNLVSKRSKRGTREKFLAAMDKIPNNPPRSEDELSDGSVAKICLFPPGAFFTRLLALYLWRNKSGRNKRHDSSLLEFLIFSLDLIPDVPWIAVTRLPNDFTSRFEALSNCSLIVARSAAGSIQDQRRPLNSTDLYSSSFSNLNGTPLTIIRSLRSAHSNHFSYMGTGYPSD